MAPWFLKLGKPAAQLLGNVLTGGLAGDPAGELADQALKPLIDKAEERRLGKQLEAVGKAFVQTLSERVGEFAAARATEHLNVEAVVVQIERNLTPALQAEFFLGHDLDAEKIEAAVRENYPLPSAQLSRAETDLYDLALGHAVWALVDLAYQLEGFASRSVAEQLGRLTELRGGD